MKWFKLYRILAAILDFVEETEKREKEIARQIPQGQYAYCKYLEIIRVGVFEWDQKQVAAAAGGLSKNNKSPPPHSGWRLNNHTLRTMLAEHQKNALYLVTSVTHLKTFFSFLLKLGIVTTMGGLVITNY